MALTIEIPQDILTSSRLTMDELKQEMAVLLYQQNRLSVGKARELAGMSLWQFRQLLASRLIPVHLDEEDVLDELDTLERLGRL
ncbi:MAG: UPF0175 family protein [Chloroflexi bacterium]|nr:UPF0175 family protein [Chloroflexota bacterium]MBP8055332.1 UPF0175 family protein [Chloroflexota bacterium]